MEAVSMAHDGRPASIVRRVGGDTLFDRIFTEAPFSAEWLLSCTQDLGARDILTNHLAWRVIDIWESALRTVMSHQSSDFGIVLRSVKPLPPIVTESVPISIQDSHETDPGSWITIVKITEEALSISELEAKLQALLPDYGITLWNDSPK